MIDVGHRLLPPHPEVEVAAPVSSAPSPPPTAEAAHGLKIEADEPRLQEEGAAAGAAGELVIDDVGTRSNDRPKEDETAPEDLTKKRQEDETVAASPPVPTGEAGAEGAPCPPAATKVEEAAEDEEISVNE